MGSTIVDGPEVPEDWDPAQREAEGPRSSMDYSEFPLLDFSHQKNPGAPAPPALYGKNKYRISSNTPRNRRSVRRPMEGSEVTMALYGKTEYEVVLYSYRSIYTYRQGEGYNAD